MPFTGPGGNMVSRVQARVFDMAFTRVADRHFLIERGRVVWSGSSPELAAAPEVQHRFLEV